MIQIEKLTKRFGDFTAVDEISFEVNEGEIFGFLGPNGAGKTTTISMLVTLLEPTSGEAFVNGFSIIKGKADVRRSIGIVFQDQSLDDELTGYENMDFHGRVYGVSKEDRGKRIAHLLSLVGLFERKDDLVRTYSGGMRRRLEIARALLHNPKVLFLDEPTVGLDPQTRNNLWQYIKDLNRNNKMTVILTTHYMEEADALCNRVAIIDHGKIIALDKPEILKKVVSGGVISLKTSNNELAVKSLSKLNWVNKVIKHDGNVDVTLEHPEKHLSLLFKVLDKNKIKIDNLSLHTATLEDVFLHFTGKTIREEEANDKDAMKRMRTMRFGGRR